MSTARREPGFKPKMGPQMGKEAFKQHVHEKINYEEKKKKEKYSESVICDIIIWCASFASAFVALPKMHESANCSPKQ